ncbi:MAG: hypothetical protein DRR19_28605 [Candidatus Parabeggiatoa sp. nov. 1]|nr:MAG: hypothetical protein DRR19_28605 [Gammaproteobacteria bacterium]
MINRKKDSAPFSGEADASPQKVTRHISSLKAQIDNHEPALTKMIESLTPAKMESLRMTVEYLWGKSYSKADFNQSTLLELMKERLNLRQDDVQRGFAAGLAAGRTEGKTEERTKVKALAQQMAQEGKMTPELAEFLRRLEAPYDKQKDG